MSTYADIYGWIDRQINRHRKIERDAGEIVKEEEREREGERERESLSQSVLVVSNKQKHNYSTVLVLVIGLIIGHSATWFLGNDNGLLGT